MFGKGAKERIVPVGRAALGDRGRLARAYGTGTMVLWVSILLAFYLILYYA